MALSKKRKKRDARTGGKEMKGTRRLKRDEMEAAHFMGQGDDEEISSESEADEAAEEEEDEEEEDGVYEDKETSIEARRLRMAREYMAQMREDDDEEEEDEEELAERLAERREARSAYRDVADETRLPAFETAMKLKAHRGAVTCVAISGTRVYSGSKDNSLWEHDAATGKMTREMIPRWPRPGPDVLERARGNDTGGTLVPRQSRDAEILAIAVQGPCVAAAGSDALIHLWDARSSKLVASCRGHRGPVQALAFSKVLDTTWEQSTLFSGGADGVVRHWRGGKFVEALYGHESRVSCLDTFSPKNQPLSSGSDHSVRAWKLQDETHLVYRPKTSSSAAASTTTSSSQQQQNANPLLSVDCVAGCGDSDFLSAGDDGRLSLWSTKRKKPLLTLQAHSGWVQSLAVAPNTDLAATGSDDARLRFWKVQPLSRNAPALEPLFDLTLPPSHCTGLAFSNSLLAVALSREPRLGRWSVHKKAPNAVFLLPWHQQQQLQ